MTVLSIEMSEKMPEAPQLIQGPYGHALELAQVLAAIETVMATHKVVALAVVSVYFEGVQAEVDLASGVELVRGGLASWRQHGMP